MKVLVLGAYGMLGHKLLQELSNDFDTLGTCRKVRLDVWSRLVPSDKLVEDVDAEDFPSVDRALTKTKPDVVVNCIGIVKQLEAGKDPIRSITVNSLFPHHLAKACNRHGARLVHFSTDCVFSGKKGMYRADDYPDAEDLYGRTKFLGELTEKHTMTIRSSIIGRELGSSNGLVEWFLRQRGKKVKGYANAIYTGLTTIEMSKVVKDVIGKHKDLHGIWQVASEPISKFDLLGLINSELRLGVDLEKDTTVAVDRSLDGSEFEKRTGYKAPSWKSMIRELAEDSKSYDTLAGKG
ncbi:MAG TPA: SDR family oxidoreductase [Thermoplasmata archaeon]|jgi:dTDP-4-dehydrorhamnose reductase